jgi:hypothetical protein
MRLNHGISLIFVSGITSLALALPPSRSAVCGSTLNAISQLTTDIQAKQYQRANEKYILNSLSVISDFQSRMRSPKLIRPDVPSGIWEFKKNEKAPEEALARVLGIVEFMKNRDSDDSSKSQFTLGAIIDGENDIHNFINSLRSNTKSLDKNIMEIFYKQFRKASAVTSFFLYKLMSPDNPDFWHQFANGDSTSQAAVAALFLGALVLKQDAVLKRPFQWEFDFESRLQKINNFILTAPDGSFLVSGKNYKMTENNVSAITERIQYHDMDEMMAAEAYLENPALTDMPIIKHRATIRPNTYKQGWVGIDWILTKSAGKVELLVLARYSPNRPVYPKPSPVKSKVPDKVQLAPDMLPVPIPIK